MTLPDFIMPLGGKKISDIETEKLFSEGQRVAIDTLGCKLNQAESEILAGQLHASGYRIVPAEGEADIYILNTCTVTHVADRKSRHMLRMAHRQNPQARIIVMGCYAQRAVKELEDIEGVSLVVNNSQKTDLIKLLDTITGREQFEGSNQGFYESGKHNRTRTFIKAQDGCDSFCTYCIVPLVRGREVSLPPEQIIEQIKGRVSHGYKETVLTGTEIGRYQYNSLDLTHLLERILSETAIPRLRMSSLQPQEISIELLRLWENRRLCRHFHLSLQSGSDGVLQRMNRRYSVRDYEKTVWLIRSEIPDVAITTDIIVGFPGETQAEFGESLEFCGKMEFARMHVFPYSAREGTRAAQMSGRLEPQLKKQRMDAMLLLAKSSMLEFNQKFLGRTLPVLFEQKAGPLWSGVTDNYIKVYAKSVTPLTNLISPVCLVNLREDGVQGTLQE
jgi:threonylcarbamoyladenosine tRNA methylthiotransferase MtaB